MKLSEKAFNDFVNFYQNKGKRIIVETYRSNKVVYKNGEKAFFLKRNDYSDIKQMKNKNAGRLISQVRNSAIKYLLKNDNNIREFKSYYPGGASNRYEFENNIETGEKLKYIDIKHCYWKIAYDQGIISKKLFEKYKNNEDYKLPRNIALACLVTKKSRTYINYSREEPKFEVSEEVSLLNTVYRNIRFRAYNILGYIYYYLGSDALSYRTDGILLKNKQYVIDTVIDYLEGYGFEIENIDCYKYDNERFYSYKQERSIYI